MRYDQNLLDDIRSANSIVDVIGDYLPLRRSGANYSAPCPFHSETQASFMVSPRLQIFKCFGCGKGGNVFTFLMEYEKITFNEAVQKLADRAGIKLPSHEESSPEKRSLFNALYGMYEAALRYFCHQLSVKENNGLTYLKKRNIDDKTIKTFNLGLALEKPHGLYNQLQKKGFSKNIIMKSGLFTSSNGDVRDKFFDRIIFPVFSTDGKVIAFGSRIYKEEDDRGAKYLNSPETPIYQKRKHLYGLYQTKSSVIKKDAVLLVEGNVDLIKVWQHGFTNVVASLGTSLTEEQIKLISRYTKNILMLYDSDSAGNEAAARAISTCLEHHITPKIIMLPPMTDPDDYLEEHGHESLQELIVTARTFYQFIYEIRLAQKNLDQKRKAIDEVIEYILLIDDLVQREMYIQECADFFKVSETSIYRTLQSKQKKSWEKRTPLNLHVDPYHEEKEIVRQILVSPHICQDYLDNLEVDYFSHPVVQKIIIFVKTHDDYPDLVQNGAKFLDNFDPDDAQFIADLLFNETPATRLGFEKMVVGFQIKKLNIDLQALNEYIIKHPDNEKKIKEKEVIQKKINELKKHKKGGTVKKLLS